MNGSKQARTLGNLKFSKLCPGMLDFLVLKQ